MGSQLIAHVRVINVFAFIANRYHIGASELVQRVIELSRLVSCLAALHEIGILPGDLPT